MLDQETKRRVDSARDILVGKVPDPKAQVEQITTALIYKFMDDMDKEAEELGGKAEFFANGYEKYSWSKLMDKRLSGQQRLDLYVQAITNMSKNPHIPQLFRDMFKDAFLPYRDYEVLSLFLKEIDGFTYEHSENLGDAFEYLLAVLGSQGNAGQFRTPRHIIDFIVEVVDPKKNENILDPACGTAGFLISSYKHIIKHNSSNYKPAKENVAEKIPEGESAAETVLQEKNVYAGDNLSPEEKARIMENIAGYDISPDMVKLSLVNLYLHGFSNPVIHEYDTLTSEKRWNESFDCIMANPPFMTPKGGIRPHKRFQVQANRSEVLFVDYILEHLNINGRAGIIVPEGIIFQNANAYKRLRRLLIEDGLFAVVSLPPGVFNPYSGVKTSVLFFDNHLAKKTTEILFVKVENDGFDLGAQRRKIDKNDLPEALSILEAWKNGTKQASDIALWAGKRKIAETSDYNLSGDRYKEITSRQNQKWPEVDLGDVCHVFNGYAFKSTNFNNERKGLPVIRIRDINSGFSDTYYDGDYDSKFLVSDGDLLIGMDGDFKAALWSHGKALLNQRVCRLQNFEGALKEYVFFLIQRELDDIHKSTYKVTVKHLSSKQIEKIKIPLPPVPVQQEIVDQIIVKKKAIEHAKEVIINIERERLYFGQELGKLEDVEWVELGDLFEKRKDQVNPKGKSGRTVYVGLENIESNTGRLVGNIEEDIEEIKSLKNKFSKGDILYGKLRPNLNKVWCADREGICSTDIFVLRKKSGAINENVYALLFRSEDFNKEVLKGLKGAQLPRVGYEYLYKIKIPVLLPDYQARINEEISQEEEAISSNRTVIDIYERKIVGLMKEL